MSGDAVGVAMIGNIDLSGVFRGRSFPAERLDSVLSSGLPWVPGNICLSPCNTIPPDNPWGPVGETRFMADRSTRVTLPARGEKPAAALYLADIRHHDGSPWDGCARTQLARALDLLEERYGLTMQVGFEQECYIKGLDPTPRPAFSLSGTRVVSGLAAEVQDILSTANTRLDQFVHEYGEHQFEIAAPVRPAMRACDEAVMAREVIRDAAFARDAHATFIPRPDPAQPGSGVHIHFSLWDEANAPETVRDGVMTDTANRFVAGILKHMDAVMGFTTPSPNSFDRLRPSSWVGVYKCVGTRNREAAIRVVPRAPAGEGRHPGASLEFRVADGTANPYLCIAALIHAGMAGLAEGVAAPEEVEVDPATLPAMEREARGIAPLASSLADIVGHLERTGIGAQWFGDLFWSAYLTVRRNEMNDAATWGEDYAKKIALAI
ncbi:MAG: glutamine synthetase family protein [Pseudomonadota bacterium]